MSPDRSRFLVDLVVLDMGGTTVRDDGVVPYALRRALEPYGIHPSDDEVSAVRGAAKRAALATLLCQAQPDHGDLERETDIAYERFATFLQTAYAEGPIAEVEGASDTFAWLREHGARVALTTGFDRTTRDLILRRLGWDDGRLDAAVSAEDVAAGRPAPYMLFRAMELTGTRDVRRIAAVGDTALDLEAGSNAGAAIVAGVLGGAHDLTALGCARHTHLLTNLSDLRMILLG
jgi:phosphonatase-like hydrolase